MRNDVKIGRSMRSTWIRGLAVSGVGALLMAIVIVPFVVSLSGHSGRLAEFLLSPGLTCGVWLSGNIHQVNPVGFVLGTFVYWLVVLCALSCLGVATWRAVALFRRMRDRVT